jgi:hypothetical protein
MNKILDTYQGFEEVQELVDVGGGFYEGMTMGFCCWGMARHYQRKGM